MTNNDIFRRLRFILNTPDKKVVKIFSLVGENVMVTKVSAWLKKEDEAGFEQMPDLALSHFLNGLIIEKRGPSDQAPEAEAELNNNIILRKLRIAFNLKSDDILSMLEKNNFRLGKAELSAFFRKPDHKHYRVCKTQVLRQVLTVIQQTFAHHSKVQNSANKPTKKPTKKLTPKQIYVNPDLKPKEKSGKNTLSLGKGNK